MTKSERVYSPQKKSNRKKQLVSKVTLIGRHEFIIYRIHVDFIEIIST